MNCFHVYKKKLNGVFWHVTDVIAKNRVDAITSINKWNSNETYKVTGVMLDTGNPYNANDFPLHVRKRIASILNGVK